MIVFVLASKFVFLKSAKVWMRMLFKLVTFTKTKLNVQIDYTKLVSAAIQFDRLSHYQRFQFILAKYLSYLSSKYTRLYLWHPQYLSLMLIKSFLQTILFFSCLNCFNHSCLTKSVKGSFVFMSYRFLHSRSNLDHLL